MIDDRTRRELDENMEGFRRITRAVCLIVGIYMSARGAIFMTSDNYHQIREYCSQKQVETEKPIGKVLKSLDRKVEASNSLLIGFSGLGVSYMLRRKNLRAQTP